MEVPAVEVQLLNALLRKDVPVGSVVSLLLESDTPGIFFPLVMLPDEGADASEGIDYYLLPFQYREGDPVTFSLSRSTDPDVVLKRGRIELACGLVPCRQRVDDLGRECAAGRLLLLRSTPKSQSPPRQLQKRELQLLATALGRLVELWIERHFAAVAPGAAASIDDYGVQILRPLQDLSRDPPFFPLLEVEVQLFASAVPHTEVGGGLGDGEKPLFRRRAFNALGWNCYAQGTGYGNNWPWLEEMAEVLRAAGGRPQWWEDLRRHTRYDGVDAPLRAQIDATLDRVDLMGVVEHDGETWTLLRRHNKSRDTLQGLLLDGVHPRFPHVLPCAPEEVRAEPDGAPAAPRSGDLFSVLRHTLETLTPEPDDILVTSWALREGGGRVMALPLGIRPGEADHPLPIGEFDRPDVLEPLTWEGVRLVVAHPNAAGNEDFRRRMRERLELYLRRAAEGLREVRRIRAARMQDLLEKNVQPARGFFPPDCHDCATYDQEPSLFAGAHDRAVRCVSEFMDSLREMMQGRERSDGAWDDGCPASPRCWHLPVLKALDHEALHPALVLQLLGAEKCEECCGRFGRRAIETGERVSWGYFLNALWLLLQSGWFFRAHRHDGADRLTLLFGSREDFSADRLQDLLKAIDTARERLTALDWNAQTAVEHLETHSTERRALLTTACSIIMAAAERIGVEMDREDDGWSLVVTLHTRNLEVQGGDRIFLLDPMSPGERRNWAEMLPADASMVEVVWNEGTGRIERREGRGRVEEGITVVHARHVLDSLPAVAAAARRQRLLTVLVSGGEVEAVGADADWLYHRRAALRAGPGEADQTFRQTFARFWERRAERPPPFPLLEPDEEEGAGADAATVQALLRDAADLGSNGGIAGTPPPRRGDSAGAADVLAQVRVCIVGLQDLAEGVGRALIAVGIHRERLLVTESVYAAGVQEFLTRDTMPVVIGAGTWRSGGARRLLRPLRDGMEWLGGFIALEPVEAEAMRVEQELRGFLPEIGPGTAHQVVGGPVRLAALAEAIGRAGSVMMGLDKWRQFLAGDPAVRMVRAWKIARAGKGTEIAATVEEFLRALRDLDVYSIPCFSHAEQGHLNSLRLRTFERQLTGAERESLFDEVEPFIQRFEMGGIK